MKTKLAAAALAALAASTTCAERQDLAFDAQRHSVSFTATSTDCGMDMQLEFLFVGPNSDRDYEAMFVTDAPIKDIAAAFEKAGIPAGRPYAPFACRLWPAGVSLKIEPALDTLVREMRGDTTPRLLYAGGTRGADGVPEADTNMPAAVFALYNCSQSLLQFNDSLEQSPTYGRFQPGVKIPKGERRTFIFTWSGTNEIKTLDLILAPGKLPEAMATLRDKSRESELDVLCDFSPELTVKEAGEIATALAMVDSVRVKLNGTKEGQFFFRAYLPLEKWRDRAERLAQPPEVRFCADGSIVVTEIKEDWSDEESLDPKLTPVERKFNDVAEAARLASSLAARTMTVLVFAQPGETLGRLYDFRRKVSGTILNWYVFAE